MRPENIGQMTDICRGTLAGWADNRAVPHDRHLLDWNKTMATSLLDTSDLGEVESVLSAAYARMRISATSRGEPIRAQILRSEFGSLQVDECSYSFDLSYDTQPVDSILLCEVSSGAVETRLPNASPAHYTAGEVLAFGAHEGVPVQGCVYQGRYHQLVVPRDIFDSYAAPNPEVPVRLLGSTPVSPGAHRHLAAVINHVRQIVSDIEVCSEPLVAGAIQRYVAEAMLAALPNTALVEPTIEDRHDSTPVLLRRAMAFIDDNAFRNVTLTEIAAAAYVTPRALQYAFRKHRDCTPMEYLRQVRLHYAHLDLIAGDRRTTTVAAIARRWGFAHVGRFAALYRDYYSESPHQTLRR